MVWGGIWLSVCFGIDILLFFLCFLMYNNLFRVFKNTLLIMLLVFWWGFLVYIYTLMYNILF